MTMKGGDNLIVLFKDDKGAFRWRVGSKVEYNPGEQLFSSPDLAADALGFALRNGFSLPYCAALAESILDDLTAKV